ncbi:MAG TPA: 3-isopropylmalate dehydratase small subunit [Kiritimatiellia bacterium]|nr:3-isopropylmalate dehydratase small subunit [Kiritimatiellia bacterium]HNS81339.1 3-isopropylmalate dehydratase small subunit [Kiritimatiellia bacterium]HPA77096.1 3-isopropylmalate dehydratase small subunit [Kiritimatiellia bacterium]HQQ03346.1 3-isopropylmalate dehydratase small subunit [Kiritimatiellia bacterium]
MEAFSKHKGLVAVLDRANVDTDQIIPKQFLKSIRRTGFGEALFYDWRYLDDGSDNPDFELNHPRYKGASVLVVRNNFGCGSSREHAVWAVAQYGLKVLIAPWREASGQRISGFADIFRNNCTKNGVLTVELSEDEVSKIMDLVRASEGLQMTADLPAQKLIFHLPKELVFSFDIDAGLKEYLLKGLDDIGSTLGYEADISAFEKKHDPQMAK